MVYILLAPGFEDAEALVPADLLRRAGIETALTALEGEWVESGHGISVKADRTLAEVSLEQGDMIMLPGGADGYRNLGKSAAVETLVKDAVRQNIWVAAICAAPTLLGRWGLLEGKQAVCYPGMEKKLEGARVSEESVVRDGNIITSRGAGTSFDFALELIGVLAGEEKAAEIARSVCYR